MFNDDPNDVAEISTWHTLTGEKQKYYDLFAGTIFIQGKPDIQSSKIQFAHKVTNDPMYIGTYNLLATEHEYHTGAEGMTL